MSKVEEMANMCLQARGYFVVACYKHDGEQEVGDIIDMASGAAGDLYHPLVVVATTNEADFLEQAQLLKLAPQPKTDRFFYYRTAAE